MMSLSGLVSLMVCAMATFRGPDSAQHIQPPASCLTTTSLPDSVVSAALRIASSMPSEPNSLTSTHHLAPAGLLATSCAIQVDLPAPRGPVMMLAGIGSFMGTTGATGAAAAMGGEVVEVWNVAFVPLSRA